MPITAKETKEIFLQALDHESGEAREAYLRDACARDEQLLGQVRALLDAHEDDDERFGFLDSSPPSGSEHVFPLSTLNRERESEDLGTIGDYELLEVIGRGAMGVVYRANQLSLNREVAVKMIRGSFLSTESDVARFRQEAEAAANLKHSNIVPIYEIREIDDIVFFSMKMLGGGSMSDRMKEMQRHPREAIAKLALIAKAIHIAHINGIIHRDVKPSNILLDEEGAPYLTDFGLAKNTESELGHTLSGHLVGTPSYMAPEQASQGKSLTTLADVYSLGAVLYEVLTGKPPFTGESLMQVLESLRESDPELPSSLVPEVHRDLEIIAMKCLEKNPENRYPSANSVAEELERWLRGDPIEARSASQLTRVGRWIKRQPVVAGLLGLVAILLLTLAVGGPLSAIRESRLKEEARASEDDTREARDRLRRELYASEMRLAFQIAEQPEAIPQLKTLLNKWEPHSDLRGWEWDYLLGLTRRGIFHLPPDDRGKATPRWCPDSDHLLIRYQRGAGKADLWNWKSNKMERSFTAPKGPLKWNEEGDAVISNNEGARLVLDLTKETAQPLKPKPAFPRTVRFETGQWNADGEYFALIENRELRIWSSSEKRFLEFDPLPGSTNDLAWQPQGRRLAVSGLYQGCLIWDPVTRKFTRLEEESNYSGHGPLAWHPRKSLLAVGDQKNNTARIWDIDNQTLLRESSISGGISDFSWSPSGEKLAIGGGDAVVRVQETNTYRTIAIFPPSEKKTDRVFSLDWSHDEEHLAAGYASGQVQAWSLRRERRLAHPVVSRTFQAIWAPDGRSIISTGLGKDSGLHHLNLDSGSLTKLDGAPPWILSMDWNAQSNQVVASTLSREHLLLFEAEKPGIFQEPSPLHFEEQSNNEFPHCLFDPAGSRLALIRPEAIEIKDFPNGEFRAIPVDLHTRYSTWSPDGRFLASSGEDGFSIIDTKDLKQVESIKWPLAYNRPSWSPDGKKLAIPNSSAPKIGIWDLHSRSWETEIMGHSGNVSRVAWSPKGRRLASAEGANILIWDTETWDLLGVLRKHSLAISDLSWSPDGNSLLSLGKDQLLVWEVE